MDGQDQSVWELLIAALQKIGEFRGEITLEIFQKIIRAVLRKTLKRDPNLFRDFYVKSPSYQGSAGYCQLYNSLKYKFESKLLGEKILDPVKAPDPLTLQKMKLLSEAGVGLSQFEYYNLMIAMRRIAENNKLSKARIWGKIYGLQKDYYVIEVEPDKEEAKKALARDKLMTQEAKVAEAARKAKEFEKTGEKNVDDMMRGMKEEVVAIKEGIVAALVGPEQQLQQLQTGMFKGEPMDPIAAQQLLAKYVMPPIPQPPEFKALIVPPEPLGSGVNIRRYYVANEPWQEFTLLPDAVPACIVTARCIWKYLTGNLDAPVESYPDFPGLERDLLRCQIARISAGTIVCPVGVYTVPSGEEATYDEDEMLPDGYMENEDYHPPPLKRLVDIERNFWMHTRKYILPQGRTEYWKPPDLGDEFEGFEDWDEDEMRGRLKPPVLTLIGRDDSPEVEKCWSMRRPYRTVGDHNCITIRSNVWPGASAVTRGFLWDNIYIGFGVKYLRDTFGPAPLPFPWDEYELGPEIQEMTDPTPEEEEAWRLRHTPATGDQGPPVAEGEGEFGEGEDDEDEE
ncbi:Radial spokehead-like protein [Nesidiocoris tenuis]|nr:Radial spokehead-like protein [Nesidiocoris tenuis]